MSLAKVYVTCNRKANAF